MAVSVIDTRGEFKLVPYSGDGVHWPQWVLKFDCREKGKKERERKREGEKGKRKERKKGEEEGEEEGQRRK